MKKYHKTDIAPVEQENERDETYRAGNPQIDCTRTSGNHHIVKRSAATRSSSTIRSKPSTCRPKCGRMPF